MIEKDLWKKVLEFHGHECGGLTIGVQAAIYAKELLELDFSKDEQVVCVAENDACGIDGIQVLLGCSVGKGNLLFHMTGKSAYSFYNRKTGKSVRLVLKPTPKKMSKKASFDYYQSKEANELFEVKETTIVLPESARLFQSYACEKCGESTAENYLRLEGGKKMCLDCYSEYKRFSL